jgi:hypothetical protein
MHGFLILWLSLAIHSHDFHASLADCTYQKHNGSIECTIRVFSDDLEAGVSAFSNKKFLLEESDTISYALENYLHHKFGFSLNGTQKPIRWIGKELQQDVCYLYGECLLPGLLEAPLEIHYGLFLELFSDQRNLLNLKLPQKKETFVFEKGTPRITIQVAR